MRDVLTILAGLVIAVLVAALAVPPLLDWTAYRSWVDRGIARATGQEARTEGPLDIRLLPTPRIRIRRLQLGSFEPESPSLDAWYLRAEIALTPLLTGEVRFLDTRIGRAEIKLPTGAGGDWRVPERFLEEASRRRSWVFEDLFVHQLLVTTADPATGRTDQVYGERVHIQAQSLAGPWRFDGTAGGRPFEIALGEITAERTAAIKFGRGGGGAPRLDIDGQITLESRPGGSFRPLLVGTGRYQTTKAPAKPAGGPAETAAADPLPLRAQADIRASGRVAELANVAVEAGDGAGAVRLTGEGRYRLDDPNLSLTLAARRLDLAAFRQANGAGLASLPWRSGARLPLDLSLRLDSLAVGADEDLTGLSLSLSIDGERGAIRSFEASGPGRSTLRAEGNFWLGLAPGLTASLAFGAGDGERFARALEGVGLRGAAGLLEPSPVEGAADLAIADPVVSLRNLRLVQGSRRLSGTVRYTEAEAGARPRLDAQLAVEGLDVAALPAGAPLFALARGHDLGLAIDARNVVHDGRPGGHISGRLLTRGSEIALDSLEVRGLAGAEASLSGRIAPDGAGRIEGRLTAPRAAPLLDLFGQAWLGGLAGLVPRQIRDDAVDLRLDLEQARLGPGSAPSIRTRLEGSLAGGPFEAMTRVTGGSLAELAIRAEGENWLGAPTGAGGDRITLSGRRDPDGRLAVTLAGEAAGLAVTTEKPLRLGSADDSVDEGVLAISGPDATPLLARLGLPPTGDKVPVAMTGTLARKDGALLTFSGRIAERRVSGELSGLAAGEIRGSASVERLSLPWLASALALGPSSPAAAGSVWPSARFGAPASLSRPLSLNVRATELDLGSGFVGRDVGFGLNAGGDGLRISRLDTRIGEARLRGDLAIDRQGGLASVTGEGVVEGLPLSGMLGAAFGSGRLTAKLRFGSSGESLAGLVANLAGAGEVSVDGLRVEGADPAAPGRVAARVLRTDDPLTAQRWQPILAEELGRAPLVAGGAVAAGGALTGGSLRLSPVRIDAEGGSWQGSVTLDLRGLSLDARGVLQSKEGPRNWSGPPPMLGLAWSGPLAKPARSIEPGPLVNGLATNILTRELDRVDTFEQDAVERQRRNSRAEMDRQRRADEARRLEEARRAREEARRAEEARKADEARRAEEARRAREAPSLPPPPARPSTPEMAPNPG
ncbi:AsmA family protein [Enterovirga rhinocerotis]|uniref:AsmA domain-containing protein n=1 Tax=Enterovirga rhinocerotis TaxID=1339210 RepID=A0A4R7BR05_9HYPH|nr:AsmA family protein [Enterovirga rhinocerotis]TDR88100.1 hypothetical protein EV668_3968 [Enterovirga rhinocerotis]